MNNPINQKSISRYVKLKDYKVFDYEIPEIFLDFVINKNAVNVTTKLKLVKKNKNTNNLTLDGTDILIKQIFIDDSVLEEEYYKQQNNNLKIKNINKDNFLINISLPSRIRFLVFLFFFTNFSLVVTFTAFFLITKSKKISGIS